MRHPLTLAVLLAASLAAAWGAVQSRRTAGLTVYVAHDLVFSEPVLRQFEVETGIPVTIVGDTEASKSLGLVRRIAAEADAPQCDVFWNNELLGTMQLAEEGLLEPYRGSGWERIPAKHKDPEGLWTGFGARLRVKVVCSAAFCFLTADRFPPSFAVADPMFGTTLTHAAAHFERNGRHLIDDLSELYGESLTVTAGNGPACELVLSSVCVSGYTDTDDAFVAREKDILFRIEPFRFGREGPTIAIPNTVAIIRGTSNRQAAERLVDWVLSERTERALAASTSRQVPLGSLTGEEPLPAEVEWLRPAVEDSMDLRGLLPARDAVLEHLTKRAAE